MTNLTKANIRLKQIHAHSPSFLEKPTLHAIKSRVTSIDIVWTDQRVSYVDKPPVIWQYRRNGFKYEIYLYIYLLEDILINGVAFQAFHR
jgi:hypothetical protein